VPAVAAVSGVTAQSPVNVPAVPLPIPAALKETIKKVAQFCASNGASTISMLKKKEGAKNVMPFLFEGQVGYEEFLSTLKNILGMTSATNTSNSSSSVPPPARP
jgi:Surp module